MNLQAMTREKLQFLLPVVFTVGPDVNQRGAAAGQAPRDTGNVEHNPEDHGDALMKYAMLLADAEREAKSASKGMHIENIVKGIIEGETRVLVSMYSPFLSYRLGYFEISRTFVPSLSGNFRLIR